MAWSRAFQKFIIYYFLDNFFLQTFLLYNWILQNKKSIFSWFSSTSAGIGLKGIKLSDSGIKVERCLRKQNWIIMRLTIKFNVLKIFIRT